MERRQYSPKEEARQDRREKQNAITQSRATLTGLYSELHAMNTDGDHNTGRKQFLLQEVRMTRIDLRTQRNAVKRFYGK